MKITVSKTFGKFFKTQKLIIDLFLLTSLVVTSVIVGVVPQIPVWVLMITIPICLISMIVFYLKSYSYAHAKWKFCNKHNGGFVFSKKKNLKYIYSGIFMLIPMFNWLPILLIKKHEETKITKEMIVCDEEHPKTRSSQINPKSTTKKREEQFAEEF